MVFGMLFLLRLLRLLRLFGSFLDSSIGGYISKRLIATRGGNVSQKPTISYMHTIFINSGGIVRYDVILQILRRFRIQHGRNIRKIPAQLYMPWASLAIIGSQTALHPTDSQLFQ